MRCVLLFLLGRFTIDGTLLCFLVERRQLTLLAKNSQQLDDERKVVELAANVLDLKIEF